MKQITILHMMLLVMPLHAVLAQGSAAIGDKTEDCAFIKINDQLVVHDGDYVLDNQRKIDVINTFLSPANIKKTYVVPNPCASKNAGYIGATIIERIQKLPIVALSLLVDDVKKEYSGFLNYEVFVNCKFIENYANWRIEISNNLSVGNYFEYKDQEKIRCTIEFKL